ncbi:EscI/YscI/HrpB family type III secretion system inner rod protein [Mesorhizobium sp. ANAO-SY3R2]|uniref:EscI/YscI/HrpB family type III secretion system inner rod protein n=1 Tax=Mesorhizobium sp. ANAO-SY3R2 TaxID=3166644 RepID=UPI003672B023
MITGIPLAAAGTIPASDAARTIPAQQVDAFKDALQRQAVDQPAATQQSGPVAVSASPPAQAELDAQARARRGLGLEGVEGASRSEPGDMILDGLQKLRGVFDAREARVSELMKSSSVDASMLMAVQMEITNFTLLVDISSKLTGKSTQALDTLMKGQ